MHADLSKGFYLTFVLAENSKLMKNISKPINYFMEHLNMMEILQFLMPKVLDSKIDFLSTQNQQLEDYIFIL